MTDDEASYQLAGAEPRSSNRTPGKQEETSALRLAVSISLNLTCMWADSATQRCANLYNLRVSHRRRLQRSKEMNKTKKTGLGREDVLCYFGPTLAASSCYQRAQLAGQQKGCDKQKIQSVTFQFFLNRVTSFQMFSMASCGRTMDSGCVPSGVS